MQWKDVGDVLKNIAGDGLPLIGSLLGGPLGEKVGQLAANALGVAATPDAVSQALKTDPEAAVKLATLASDERIKMAEVANQAIVAKVQADADIITQVNKTIQTEAVGKSWLQRNAQPLCKLSTVGLVGAIYFGLPLGHVPVPSVPNEAWLMLGAILGVTAWHEGAARVAAVKGSANE